MKKRIVSILLILCLALSVTACGGNEGATSVGAAFLNEAIQKNKALDSLAAKMEMTIDMSIQGMTLSVPVTADVKVVGETAYTKMSTSLLGQEIKVEAYMEDGWIYMVLGDQKFKNNADTSEYDYSDDMNNMMQELPDDLLKTAAVTENADGSKTAKVTLSGKQFTSLFSAFVDGLSATTGTGIEGVTIGDAVVSVTVAEGYVTEYDMEFSMNMTAAGTETATEVKATMTFEEPGSTVTITPPEGYQDFPDGTGSILAA